jgi:hypothetical protein
MWELALLIVSIAFSVLVIFTIPFLLQLFHSTRELELTLRETREAIRKIREISDKAEVVVDQGKTVMEGAGRALAALDGLLGNKGATYVTKVLTTAINFMPVAMAAQKLFATLKRRKDHV